MYKSQQTVDEEFDKLFSVDNSECFDVNENGEPECEGDHTHEPIELNEDITPDDLKSHIARIREEDKKAIKKMLKPSIYALRDFFDDAGSPGLPYDLHYLLQFVNEDIEQLGGTK